MTELPTRPLHLLLKFNRGPFGDTASDINTIQAHMEIAEAQGSRVTESGSRYRLKRISNFLHSRHGFLPH